MKCPICGGAIKEDVDFCVVCAAKMGVPAAESKPAETILSSDGILFKKCSFCGGKLREDEDYCAECAAKMGVPAAESKPTETIFSSDGILLPTSFNPVQCLVQGWKLVMSQPEVYLSCGLFYTALFYAIGSIQKAFMGAQYRLPQAVGGQYTRLLTLLSPTNISQIISSLLVAGLFVMAFKSMKNQKVKFGDLFSGFKWFTQLVLLSIVTNVFVGIGFILFVLPGIYLLVCYTFAVPLVVERNVNFRRALGLSLRAVRPKWFSVLYLLSLLLSINIFSILSIIVVIYVKVQHVNTGPLIILTEILNYLSTCASVLTTPVMVCATAVAYTHFFERESEPATAA